MDQKQDMGWVKLFHPRGVQVTLPVIDVTPAGSLAAVGAFLDAGWLVTAPGLEDGEEKEMIGWVLRGTHEKDGEATPFVLLYSANDALKWSILKVYLNTDDDVAAFEFASKVKLDSLPEYVADNKPERGQAKTDRFIVAAPRPFGVVYRKNPKYDPNETDAKKKKPARLFVRWADQRPAAAEVGGPMAAYTRAITQSLTLESLKQAFSEAYQDSTLTRTELDKLTALKDERKTAIGQRNGMYPAAGNDPAEQARRQAAVR